MSVGKFKEQIEGYHQILSEINVLQKYGLDYTVQKGRTDSSIEWLHPKRLNLRVSELIRETPSTFTLRMVSNDRYLPPFQAGQYINLFVDVEGVRTSRPYSISSPPNQTGYYDLTIKRQEDGFVSNYVLNGVRVGDNFTATSPAGNFYFNPVYMPPKLVFLAGGSGITPFMSMIREVTDRGLNRQIHVIYGSYDPNDIIFKAELEARALRHSNLTVSPIISGPFEDYQGLTGFISAGVIKQLIEDISSTMFFICGPEAMYSSCLREIEKLGVPFRRVKAEVFGPPKDVTRQPAWPKNIGPNATFQVKIKNGPEFSASAEEPLINVLERKGISLEAGCRSGECSLCRTRLLKGKVFHPDWVKLRYSDHKFGYIHPCMAYPLEDLVLDI